jgi:hypothetical protein
MRLKPQNLKYWVVILVLFSPALLRCQQVVERGAGGRPAQVVDETGEWTTPLLLVSDKDVQIYMPDVTSPDWLKLNYPDYHDRSFYTITIFTFYKTPEACRANQTAWGMASGNNLNDCISIGYRVRSAIIHPHEQSVTLLKAAMVDLKGAIIPDSIQTDRVSRFWNQLDENSQTALNKANGIVAEPDENLRSETAERALKVNRAKGKLGFPSPLWSKHSKCALIEYWISRWMSLVLL